MDDEKGRQIEGLTALICVRISSIRCWASLMDWRSLWWAGVALNSLFKRSGYLEQRIQDRWLVTRHFEQRIFNYFTDFVARYKRWSTHILTSKSRLYPRDDACLQGNGATWIFFNRTKGRLYYTKLVWHSMYTLIDMILNRQLFVTIEKCSTKSGVRSTRLCLNINLVTTSDWTEKEI